MADWILIPCLVQLREEFNRIAPKRDKASDGSIGNTAHQQETSDHNADEVGRVPIHDGDKRNEVHAIDVDDDLRSPNVSMERVVQFLLARCRSGAERRLRYIIYNRRIWSASSGWVQKTYTGASPHTEHAHFSGSYDTAREASTASWHLEDLTKESAVAVTEAEMNTIASKVVAALCTKTAYGSGGGDASPVGRAVLDSDYPAAPGAQRTDLWANLQAIAEDVKAGNVDAAAAKDMLLQLLQDPTEPGHPIVEAVRYAIANP
jgi:hypothetical protein